MEESTDEEVEDSENMSEFDKKIRERWKESRRRMRELDEIS